MAVGLVLDESIAASAGRYVGHHEESVRRAEREQADRDRQAEEARHREQAEALREAIRAQLPGGFRPSPLQEALPIGPPPSF